VEEGELVMDCRTSSTKKEEPELLRCREKIEKVKDLLVDEAVIKKKINELKIKIIQLENCLKNKFNIEFIVIYHNKDTFLGQYYPEDDYDISYTFKYCDNWKEKLEEAMSKFSDLIFKEVEQLKQYGITNYSLEALCRKIDWALKIKNTYFQYLKDFVDNRNLFITALENLSDRYPVSIPEFAV